MEDQNPLRVLIVGAAHPAANFLVNYLLTGEVFGMEQSIILHLWEITEHLNLIKAMVMELQDCAFVLLKDVLVTSDKIEAYRDVDLVYMMISMKDTEKAFQIDTFRANLKHYKRHAEVLNEYANKRVKVIVCSRPINTNCLVMSRYAPNIPVENFTGVMRLDNNRAQAQLAAQLGVPCNNVRRTIIWGNHSDTMFTDISYAMVKLPDTKEMSIHQAIKNDSWIKNYFINTLQTRTMDVNFRGPGKIYYHMSLAKAIMDHSYDMWNGTSDWTPMIVYSRGEYDAPKDIFYSFPVTIRRGKWYIVDNLHIDEFSRSKLEITSKQLEQEKRVALTECG